jgi:hypothetical protein
LKELSNPGYDSSNAPCCGAAAGDLEMSGQSGEGSGVPAPHAAHARPVRRLSARSRRAARLGLLLGGTLVGLLAAELLLTVMDRPPFFKAHSFPPQFGFSPLATQGAPL